MTNVQETMTVAPSESRGQFAAENNSLRAKYAQMLFYKTFTQDFNKAILGLKNSLMTYTKTLAKAGFDSNKVGARSREFAGLIGGGMNLAQTGTQGAGAYKAGQRVVERNNQVTHFQTELGVKERAINGAGDRPGANQGPVNAQDLPRGDIDAAKRDYNKTEIEYKNKMDELSRQSQIDDNRFNVMSKSAEVSGTPIKAQLEATESVSAQVTQSNNQGFSAVEGDKGKEESAFSEAAEAVKKVAEVEQALSR